MQTTDAIEAAVDRMFVTDEPAPEPEQEQPEAQEAEVEVTADEVEAQAEAPEADTSEDDAETVEIAAPQKFTVKVDGTDTEVSLDELKRSYSGQAYIQKGMQEVAAQKKQATEFLASLQQEQANLQAFVQSVQQNGLKAPPKAPDPALAHSDPIGYIQANAAYQQHLSEYQGQMQQLVQMSQAQRAAQERAMQEHLAEQVRELQSEIPDFADATKAGELKGKLVKTGEGYGFSAQELEGITDARHVKVLMDAMRWRELQANKATPVKPEAKPRVVTPTARRPEPAQLARSRELAQAKKSGRPEAFVDLLLKR